LRPLIVDLAVVSRKHGDGRILFLGVKKLAQQLERDKAREFLCDSLAQSLDSKISTLDSLEDGS